MECAKIGDKYESHDDLEKFRIEYERRNFVQLYIRTSQSMDYYAKRNPTRDVSAKLKYSRIEYACIHGGKKIVSETTGKRPNTSTFKMECPFRLKLALTKDGKSLQIKECEESHNHVINETAYKHLPKQRQLDETTKEEARKMLKLKANKKLVQDHVINATGKIVTMRDIHNIINDRQKLTEAETLKTLLDEMKSVPGATVEVKKDETNLLTGIFY